MRTGYGSRQWFCLMLLLVLTAALTLWLLWVNRLRDSSIVAEHKIFDFRALSIKSNTNPKVSKDAATRALSVVPVSPKASIASVLETLPAGLQSPAHFSVKDTSLYRQGDDAANSKDTEVILPIDGYYYDKYVRIKKWPRKKGVYFLIVATMIRNKARYVPEWIEFHLLQGFDRFVIYDDRSTDGLKEILDPYIKMDVVEYLLWPEDADKVNRSATGPRVFDTPGQEEAFNTHFYKLCIDRPGNGNQHAHGGCQKAAALDALARYRHKTVWILHSDIDEFFYTPRDSAQTGLSGIVTVRDILAQNYHYYDQIIVQGHIFGTNGFMSDPTPVTESMPFPMVMEAYRHRRSHLGNRNQEKQIQNRIHAEKAFVKANLPTSTLVHMWTFESPIQPRTMSDMDAVMTLNHYQYRSVFGQNRKAEENNNFNIEYSRPADQFLNEVADYSIGYLVPLVRHNLQQRINDKLFIKLPSTDFWKPSRKPFDKSAKVDICIAITHRSGQVPQLRKTIHTFIHFLNTVDVKVTYKVVFVTQFRGSVGDATQQEHTQFKDFYDLVDESKYLDGSATLAEMMDAATDLCGTHAEFILYLEDVWETRFRVPGKRDSAAHIVDQPVIHEAMELMRDDSSILEVWLGDTPRHPSYTQSRTSWTLTPAALRAMDAVDVPSDAVSLRRWYRKQTGTPQYQYGVTRLGGTLRHRKRQESVGKWASFDQRSAHTALSLQTLFGEAAMAKGFASAHICYDKDPEKNPECNLNPDGLNDGSTTGIMWRQRLLLNADAKSTELHDRPLL
ncbi:hypothetical protein BASA50_010340 [Batrachochytrium salamandrivorans]|uniref:Glycosyltransferase family 92 protein n=1 Tax=Batrachochytrium salamandrivorans TaxID=1357716 RepID=A0ABQ8EYR0_9FUNG|nr:hypothetical protein BASA50_010340 [Batrachochytrium salamandrivorans]